MVDSSTLAGEQPGAPSEPADHLGPLCAVLRQLHDLVEALDAERYNAKPVTTYGGTVGGHVRHCLDHVNALLHGTRGDLIDYEARERGTNVETDPVVARQECERLEAELFALPADIGERTVTTSILLTPAGPALRAPSSVSREIAFVLSHTIHHNAMIGGMVKALGGTVPDDFGMAPGTIEHRRRATG